MRSWFLLEDHRLVLIWNAAMHHGAVPSAAPPESRLRGTDSGPHEPGSLGAAH